MYGHVYEFGNAGRGLEEALSSVLEISFLSVDRNHRRIRSSSAASTCPQNRRW